MIRTRAAFRNQLLTHRLSLKSVCFFALSISILFGLSACGSKKNEAANKGPSVKDYPVLRLELRNTTLNNKYPATVEGQQNIEIRPKIDGYVEHIYVDEGALVRQGQVLFTINAPQYEQEVRTAEANIKIAQSGVNTAEMEVNKVRPLVEKDIISKYELESAELNLQSKRATLAQAKAALANAKINLAYTRVTSPVNGIVGTIPYRLGSLVSSNTAEPLTTVSNIGKIYAYFSLNEKQILDFADEGGQGLQSIIKSLPAVSLQLANGTMFPEKGKIETASGLINTATGSIRVRATFHNPNNVIRSGSSGLVIIPQYIESAIIIPQSATFEIQGERFVYVLADGNKIAARAITTMENSDGRFYVVQEGLEVGDKIVLEGIGALRDGDEIIPKEAKAAEIYGQEAK